MVTMARPDYVTAITQNSPGKLEPGTKSVVLQGTGSGRKGNRAEGTEAVAMYVQYGSGVSANWVIDYDGTIYEITGWDRAAWSYPADYVIALAQPTTFEQIKEPQYQALDWLIYQLEMRKGVPRKRRMAGKDEGYSSNLGAGFTWSRVGL
jgi:hypothetical protein